MVKKHNLQKKAKSYSSKFTKWEIFYIKMGKNMQKPAPYKYKKYPQTEQLVRGEITEGFTLTWQDQPKKK